MQNPVLQLPEKFLAGLDDIIDSQDTDAVVKAMNTKRPSTFRLNYLRGDKQGILSGLKEAGISVTGAGEIADAYILMGEQKYLTQTPAYTEGLIYLQSLSSMLPAIVLSPLPGERVLDMCAAPGSKTSQMAALMQNQGEIVANDLSRIRIFKLSALLQLQGVTNTRVLNKAGQILWREFPSCFDKVLVDVPCSMEGRFNAADPKTYRDWRPGKSRELANLQKFLLRSALSCTKVGGRVVYSTCTLSPEENEAVVDWLLRRESGRVELENIQLSIPEARQGMLRWKNRQFDPELYKTVRILPSRLYEGFFIAKFRKTAENIPTQTLV